jgi:hypothetical protein
MIAAAPLDMLDVTIVNVALPTIRARFTSLTNRSTTGPNSASCVTYTDTTVANPPALRTATDSNREGRVTSSRRAPEMLPNSR